MFARTILFALLGVAVCPSGSALEASPMQQLADAMGDQITPLNDIQSKYGVLVDCSEKSISFLDKNSSDRPTFDPIYKWNFTWSVVKTDQGSCIYLEKPERRGLSIREAQVLLSAIDFPFPDWTVPACHHPISERNIERIGDPEISEQLREKGEGDGYQYNVSYAPLGKEFEALDIAQHDFARKAIGSVAHIRYEPNADLTATTNLSVQFGLAQAGGFASLSGSAYAITAAGTPRRQETSTLNSWLLHMPSGRILRFGDLVQDEHTAAESILRTARPLMLKRLSDIYILDRTESGRAQKQAEFAQKIAHATATSPDDWQLSLYFGEPCAPALLLIFDQTSLVPDSNERPQVHVSFKNLRRFLKPQFRDAEPLVD